MERDWQPSKEQQLIMSMLAQVLVNQCNISPKLKSQRKDAEFLLNAVTSGHYWAIKSAFPHYFPETISSEIAGKVGEIMQMWEVIENNYDQLSTDDKQSLEANGLKPYFKGFDGNLEPQYHSVALTLVNDMGLFEKFKGRELNTHYEMLNTYQQMLEKFKELYSNLRVEPLGAEELKTLMEINNN